MKVLHLITRLDPGGSAENTLLTCCHLAGNGWQAILASGPGWTGEEANVVEAQLPLLLIGPLKRDPSPVADARALWQIYRLLARVPVIIHTPHGHVLYGYARGLKNWIYLVAERITARVTDCLVALSEGEERESAAAGIGKPAKWVVIPSGVELEGLEPREGGSSGPLRVGCVARLEHVKGIDVLVRATAALAGRGLPPFEILVWGDGRQQNELRALSAEVGADQTLRFVGTTQAVEEFLRSLDVYVQPSRNEGMGRALVLAQGVGLPAVASNVCGIPDVVRAGETGELVDPDEPEALADEVALFLRDADKRNSFGRAARSWIMTTDETGFPKFSTAAMLWRLERLYRQLAEKA